MDWKSATTKDDGTISIPERWLHLHYYEALNVLFRMENALRVFVYAVLKNRFREKWAEVTLQTIDDEASTIAATAAKRIAQAKGFGYLGYEISSPLMYLNSGELTRLITSDAYWELFKPYFRGKKEIIKTKLDEIGTVRNSLAHFRPLKYDDIELIKQNVKHAFGGIEQCLSEMTQADRVVPTNTVADWYKTLCTLGSTLCTIRLFQDQVAKKFPKLAAVMTFMTEDIPHISMPADNSPKFRKRVSFVFSKDALLDAHLEISDQIKELLLKIETETELVQQDNLARGDVIDSARATSSFQKGKDFSWWSTNTEDMKNEFGDNDPPEYWGEMGIYMGDFIAGSRKYPWMTSDISKEENPFG